MKGSSFFFFPDLLSWRPAFYEATDACLISERRRGWNQTDIKSCLKMYNTEVNLTATVESGFDVKTGESFVFLSIHVCLLATRACSNLWMRVCVCVCARLSWADLGTEARFNEAAQTHTLYYSRAHHYSWPNSLSLLLREPLDSFPILWKMHCASVCVCTSAFVYVRLLVFLCETVLSVCVFFFFFFFFISL